MDGPVQTRKIGLVAYTPARCPLRSGRIVFALAALCNVGFGAWAALLPGSFFGLFGMEPPRYPCIGLVEAP
jgi:hypothetical protein